LHEGARAWIAEQAARLGPFESVLEIGSRNVNGSVREFFEGAEYVGLDQLDGDGVDIVADAVLWATLRQYDAIVCCEVFEHEARWPELLERIGAWLGFGAVALLTMATTGRAPHSGIDGGQVRPGEHYQNVELPEFLEACTLHGLRAEWDIRNPGDLYAVVRRGAA